MSNSRSVYQRDDGKWVDKNDEAERPAGVYDRQKDAIDSAREHLENAGGGELNIHGRDGIIRSKDTIPPGNDPNPPRDKEH
jgi:hypothetical protein